MKSCELCDVEKNFYPVNYVQPCEHLCDVSMVLGPATYKRMKKFVLLGQQLHRNRVQF